MTFGDFMRFRLIEAGIGIGIVAALSVAVVIWHYLRRFARLIDQARTGEGDRG